jgi:hypothetical protein
MEKELTFGACSSGFFSCCSIILMQIIEYFNNNGVLPEKINTERMCSIYQLFENQDIFKHIFYEKDTNITFTDKITISKTMFEPQFSDYKLINYDLLQPFFEKYFNITPSIQNKIIELKHNYYIYEQENKNLCGVFYRGNDKIKETNPPSYQEIIDKAFEIKTTNSNIKFIIQTDENDFLQYFLSIFPDSIFFKEIPIIQCQMTTVAECYKNNNNKVEILEYYIASIFILSSLTNIICTSGNGELFMCFFRKHGNGIHQYLKKNEFIHGCYNNDYNPNETQFWF